MTDIIARLRTATLPLITHAELREAAAEIERLTKLNQELVKHDGDAEAVCDSYATENQQFHDEIERLKAEHESYVEWTQANLEPRAEIERLRATLQALHDWYVEYARINNLFNADGSPATFHELLQARRALENKP